VSVIAVTNVHRGRIGKKDGPPNKTERHKVELTNGIEERNCDYGNKLRGKLRREKNDPGGGETSTERVVRVSLHHRRYRKKGKRGWGNQSGRRKGRTVIQPTEERGPDTKGERQHRSRWKKKVLQVIDLLGSQQTERKDVG